ncbi:MULTISPECIES: outer membrane beta-barrel protein [unclassified Polaribacter]|uniref:outer membrane beta-barrel protein n=1 Tax=unclassified Polaribacter TaxID=196858 RepID=UPI0011BD8F88|nr:MULTISPECIES: outer membrane beta-barrel protein [unclassified Polaribacter]TXD49527.1 porin family protein [Polaribacter sp. IC063]TXD57899.1 porin family protein [Polaribacter sp. IC066]
MKKFVLVTILLALTASAILAQAAHKKEFEKIYFGINSGFNHTFSTIEAFNIEDTGFYAGLFLEKSLSGKFNIKFETIFSTVREYQAFVVELPIMVQYKFASKVSALSGFQVDYLFGDTKRNPNVFESNFGVGLNIGFQYDFAESWFLETRYIHSITKQIETEKLKRKSVRLGIGYRF